MENDCIKHVRTCHRCQAYQDRKNAPPQPLYSLAAPYPFLAWGVDVIGPAIPKASNGHEYILMGRSRFVQEHHLSNGSLVPEAQHYLPLRHAKRAHYK